MTKEPVSEDDKDFKRTIDYFWTEKGDPTRYTGWDPIRCQRLMPAFYEAWSKFEIYRTLAYAAMEIEREERL